MKALLFCNLPYAFSILKPLQEELKKQNIPYLWFVPSEIAKEFPYPEEKITSDIRSVKVYQSDMIFVPGNDVPWYLRGVKVQIFHGLAGEKKGHFRIRNFFDLYLTQGPYFTQRFEMLAQKHKNFKVTQTGWCKLDTLYKHDSLIEERKRTLLQESSAKKVILYAPTFSPSLTSAKALLKEIVTLSQNPDYLLLIKFHDKMDKLLVQAYEAVLHDKLIISKERDITPLLKIADIMISDTSSVVYEFLLLDKPVITLNSHSEHILWKDIQEAQQLQKSVKDALSEDKKTKENRQEIIALYHPYSDGNSAKRMVDATLAYIMEYGVPNKREISLLRKYKMIQKYGLFSW